MTATTKHRRELHEIKANKKPKLRFAKNYHVTGILKLPDGDIVEPFEAWYSGDEKMSRIDYYGGKDYIGWHGHNTPNLDDQTPYVKYLV